MTYEIARSAIARPVAARFAALRVLMLSLLMLVSQGVWADPVVADQVLSVTKQNFTVLKQNYQIAKIQLQAGQTNAAVMSFTLAKVQATKMTSDLIRLLNENRHTLDNGLYQNGDEQQRTVNFNTIAKSTAQTLQVKLTILTMQPTSQIDLVIADQALTRLTFDMNRVEQAMIAAQQ
ncbi:hypothetical protein [Lysobacter sp. CA199]|uniref:hypothetical protein n=1 Tax=Lysobacter sp. CA199 TaxID=3455608 RepID=UPI003F8D2820